MRAKIKLWQAILIGIIAIAVPILLLKVLSFNSPLFSIISGLYSSMIPALLIFVTPSIQEWISKTSTNLNLKLPPEISHSNDYFTHETIINRFEEIYRRVNPNYEYEITRHKPVKFSRQKFESLIPNKVKLDDSKYDSKCIDEFFKSIEPYVKNKTKIGVFNTRAPFITVEHYFYYDLLYRYTDESSKFLDPFKKSKTEIWNANENISFLENLIDIYTQSVKLNSSKSKLQTKKSITQFINYCLQLNSSDLSQRKDRLKFKKHVIPVIDDTSSVCEYICNNELGQIDIIIDNAGVELAADIFLGLALLKFDFTKKVRFHANILPIFVSDTVYSEYSDDFSTIFEEIKKKDLTVYNDIMDKINDGTFEICPHIFWNMPSTFDKIPSSIKSDINKSNLIIFKGDLNYRRLVHDRLWQHNKSIESVVKYIKTPILIIRSLKSNVLLGFDEFEELKYENEDPLWLTSGKYGIIQFVNKKNK